MIKETQSRREKEELTKGTLAGVGSTLILGGVTLLVILALKTRHSLRLKREKERVLRWAEEDEVEELRKHTAVKWDEFPTKGAHSE